MYAPDSAKKLLEKVSGAEDGLLRSLTDQESLDSRWLEQAVVAIVNDRFALAQGFMKAARVLARETDPMVVQIRTLQTSKGPVSYSFVIADPSKDEDVVCVFTLSKGATSYRVRASMSGTLASMLRLRNRLDHQEIRSIYLERIRKRLEEDTLKPDDALILDSRDRAEFGLR